MQPSEFNKLCQEEQKAFLCFLEEIQERFKNMLLSISNIPHKESYSLEYHQGICEFINQLELADLTNLNKMYTACRFIATTDKDLKSIINNILKSEL